MATIRKRNGRWQVQVRRKGEPALSRSFQLRSMALEWARQMEGNVERRALMGSDKTLQQMSVAEILTRYRDEVIPRKRAGDRELFLVNAFLRHPRARRYVNEVSTGLISAYCAERLRTVKAASVNRELDILRHAFEVARRDWDLPLSQNPFAQIARPKAANPRSRRLQDDERTRLEQACAQCRNPFIQPLVQLALATGMRRGEILSVRWSDVSLPNRTLHIPHTKNGHERTIPLSGSALSILQALWGRRTANADGVIPISENTAKMAWRRIVQRAALQDLRFHDLRHEGISAFFERGRNVPEVALISGHRDPRMLFRCTHPKAELIAQKLA